MHCIFAPSLFIVSNHSSYLGVKSVYSFRGGGGDGGEKDHLLIRVEYDTAA